MKGQEVNLYVTDNGNSGNVYNNIGSMGAIQYY